MDAHTTANDNIRSHHGDHADALKLRVVNHKYAARIASTRAPSAATLTPS
jgi:hypothetical protein